MEVMIGMHEGKSMFAIPVMEVERYLDIPKHGRWVIYLCFALIAVIADTVCFEGKRRAVIALLEDMETT